VAKPTGSSAFPAGFTSSNTIGRGEKGSFPCPPFSLDRRQDRDVADAWTRKVEDLGVHKYKIKHWTQTRDSLEDIYDENQGPAYGAIRKALTNDGQA
jgi:hypothetical protein